MSTRSIIHLFRRAAATSAALLAALAAVPVDLSGVLRPGDRFEVRDALDFFGSPAVRGTYAGDPVAVPMDLHTVAPLAGTVRHVTDRHPAPDFGAFVVIGRGREAGMTVLLPHVLAGGVR